MAQGGPHRGEGSCLVAARPHGGHGRPCWAAQSRGQGLEGAAIGGIEGAQGLDWRSCTCQMLHSALALCPVPFLQSCSNGIKPL